MKKLISFLLTITLLSLSVFNVCAADVAEYEFGEIAMLSLGDVDADTEVDAADLVALRKKLLVTETVISNYSDMNYDGSVNIVDLVRLKKKLVGAELTSIFENQANALKNEVLNAGDNLPSSVSGKVYHVSSEGSTLAFLANGTAERPYSYSQFKNKAFTLSSGDAVLFKRGDVFYGTIRVETGGIYFGAYGEGDKPVINGSDKNYATVSWNSEGNNIYSLSGFSSDVGNVCFDQAQGIGYKRSSKSELTADLDFWYDSENGKLYLYSLKAPTSYNTIEIGVKNDGIRILASDVTIDNLAIKYTGGHGISTKTGCSNITVKNCEIGYIGGCYLGNNIRYGNGVEIWCESENILVSNNWIHDIYDSGLTHQGAGSYTAKNITFQSNLIERCGLGSIEYWLGFTDSDSDGVYEGQSKCINVKYTKNIMRYAGYGFGGEQRPDKTSYHIRSDVSCPNWSQVFEITDNIFDISTGDLFEIGGSWGPYPEMSGNTYAQLSDKALGTYGDSQTTDFNVFVKDTITKVFGDESAKVYYY